MKSVRVSGRAGIDIPFTIGYLAMWFGLLLIALFLMNRYVLDALFRYCAGPRASLLHLRHTRTRMWSHAHVMTRALVRWRVSARPQLGCARHVGACRHRTGVQAALEQA